MNAAATANQPAPAAPGTIDAMFGAILDAMNSSCDASGAVQPLAAKALPIANGAAASLIQNTATAGVVAATAAATPDTGIALASNTAAPLPGWIATLKNTPTTDNADGKPAPDAPASPSGSNTPDPSLNLMAMLQAAAQNTPQTQATPVVAQQTTGTPKIADAADTSDANDTSDATDAQTPGLTQTAGLPAGAAPADAAQAGMSQAGVSQVAAAAVSAATMQPSAPLPEQIAALKAAAGVTQKPADDSNPSKPASDSKVPTGPKPRADASKTAAKPADAAAKPGDAAAKTGDAPANDKLAAKTDNTAPVQPAQPDAARHDAAAKDAVKPDVAPQTAPVKTDSAAAAIATTAPAPIQEPRSVATDVHVSAQRHDSDAATGFDKLGVTIAAKTLEGLHEFDIRLDPPDLGRLQVKLTVDDAGQAQAAVTADKPQTLELLQRDAASLNRALTDAGLNLAGNGLSFSLREQQQQQTGFSAAKGKSRSLSATAALAASPAGAAGSYAPNSVRLDIRV